METVSVTEFRSNIKKYLDIAREEELVIYRSKSESFVITPLKKLDKEISLLNVEQKNAIDKALEDVANSRIHSHEQAMSQIKSRFPKYFK